MEGAPLASFPGETLDKNPGEPVGFHGPVEKPRECACLLYDYEASVFRIFSFT